MPSFTEEQKLFTKTKTPLQLKRCNINFIFK